MAGFALECHECFGISEERFKFGVWVGERGDEVGNDWKLKRTVTSRKRSGLQPAKQK